MKHYKVPEDFLIFKHGTIISEEDIPEPYKSHISMYLEEGHLVDSKPKVGVPEEPSLDFNGDGVFDEKDVKLGAKAMGKARQNKKKKGKK